MPTRKRKPSPPKKKPAAKPSKKPKKKPAKAPEPDIELDFQDQWVIRSYERYLTQRQKAAFRKKSKIVRLGIAREWIEEHGGGIPGDHDESPEDIPDEPSFSADKQTKLTRRYNQLRAGDPDFRNFVPDSFFPKRGELGYSEEDVRMQKILLADYWDRQQRTRANLELVNTARMAARRQLLDDSDSRSLILYDAQRNPNAVIQLLEDLKAEMARDSTARFLIETDTQENRFYAVFKDNIDYVIGVLKGEKEITGDYGSDPVLEEILANHAFYVGRPRPPRKHRKRTNRSSRKDGKFFKYTHNFETSINPILDELGLHSSVKDVEHTESCFVIALRLHPNIEPKVVEAIKYDLTQMDVPRNKLSEIGNKYGIHFKIHTMKQDPNDKLEQNRVSDYGDLNGELAEMGLFDNHYFIYKRLPISGWALRNSDHPLLKEEDGVTYQKEWWKIKSDGTRNQNISMLSTSLLRMLTKEKLLTPIDMSVPAIYETPFVKSVDQSFRTLEYPDSSVKLVHPKRFDFENYSKKDWARYYIQKKQILEIDPERTYPMVTHLENMFHKYGFGPEERLQMLKKHKPPHAYVFFDFEMTTDTPTEDEGRTKHLPYMVGWCDRNEEEQADVKTRVGRECGREMLESIADQYGTTNSKAIRSIRMIAHNVTYDCSALLEHLTNLKMVEKGTKIVTGTGIYKSAISGKMVELQFRDSANMWPMKLSEFGESQSLPIGKELMPYDLYTTELLTRLGGKRRWSYIKAHSGYDIEKLEHMWQNIHEWKCIVSEPDSDYSETEDDEDYVYDPIIDLIEYARRYCIIDVKVLNDAWVRSCKTTLEHLDMHQDGYLTQAAISHARNIMIGGYADAYSVSGVPLAFMSLSCVGGRVMTQGNKMINVKGIPIVDPDVNSEYPEAMRSCPGVPRGKPKVMPKNPSREEVDQYDYYYAEVEFLEVGVEAEFPTVCLFDGETNNWTNDVVGKRRVLDKCNIEDFEHFQKGKVRIIQGYYYDEGFTTVINEEIPAIYDRRNQLKKEENEGAQQTLKLNMNSGFGKSAQNPIPHDTVYVNGDDVNDYLFNNYAHVYSIQVMPNGQHRLTVWKNLKDQFNQVYYGSMILSHAKRVLNRVIYLGNQSRIYYTDTDSLHMDLEEFKNIEKKFREVYKQELIGKGLGQMSEDFKFKGTWVTRDGKMVECDLIPEGDIYSWHLIAPGKKTYADLLRDQKGQTTNHLRAKGAPIKCIQNVVNELYGGDPMKMYEDFHQHKPVDIMLGAGGHKSFKVNTDHSVNFITQKRTLQF